MGTLAGKFITKLKNAVRSFEPDIRHVSSREDLTPFTPSFDDGICDLSSLFAEKPDKYEIKIQNSAATLPHPNDFKSIITKTSSINVATTQDWLPDSSWHIEEPQCGSPVDIVLTDVLPKRLIIHVLQPVYPFTFRFNSEENKLKCKVTVFDNRVTLFKCTGRDENGKTMWVERRWFNLDKQAEDAAKDAGSSTATLSLQCPVNENQSKASISIESAKTEGGTLANTASVQEVNVCQGTDPNECPIEEETENFEILNEVKSQINLDFQENHPELECQEGEIQENFGNIKDRADIKDDLIEFEREDTVEFFEENAGDTAADTADETAGETAEETAGESAGETAPETEDDTCLSEIEDKGIKSGITLVKRGKLSKQTCIENQKNNLSRTNFIKSKHNEINIECENYEVELNRIHSRNIISYASSEVPRKIPSEEIREVVDNNPIVPSRHSFGFQQEILSHMSLVSQDRTDGKRRTGTECNGSHPVLTFESSEEEEKRLKICSENKVLRDSKVPKKESRAKSGCDIKSQAARRKEEKEIKKKQEIEKSKKKDKKSKKNKKALKKKEKESQKSQEDVCHEYTNHKEIGNEYGVCTGCAESHKEENTTCTASTQVEREKCSKCVQSQCTVPNETPNNENDVCTDVMACRKALNVPQNVNLRYQNDKDAYRVSKCQNCQTNEVKFQKPNNGATSVDSFKIESLQRQNNMCEKIWETKRSVPSTSTESDDDESQSSLKILKNAESVISELSHRDAACQQKLSFSFINFSKNVPCQKNSESLESVKNIESYLSLGSVESLAHCAEVDNTPFEESKCDNCAPIKSRTPTFKRVYFDIVPSEDESETERCTFCESLKGKSCDPSPRKHSVSFVDPEESCCQQSN